LNLNNSCFIFEKANIAENQEWQFGNAGYIGCMFISYIGLISKVIIFSTKVLLVIEE